MGERSALHHYVGGKTKITSLMYPFFLIIVSQYYLCLCMFGGISYTVYSEIQSFNVLFNEFWQMYIPSPDLTNQDTEHFNHCRMFPYALVQSILTSIRGTHFCDFYHHILVLLVLELHNNEVIQYVLFYILFLLLNRMFLRLSMLLY